MTIKKQNTTPALWLYNLSNKDISLGDLYCTIPARKGVNLLKMATLDQINKSVDSGSLSKRKDVLKFGGEPGKPIKRTIEVSQLPMERPFKGGIEMVPQTFDDPFLDQTKGDDLKYIEDLLGEETEEELWTPKNKK